MVEEAKPPSSLSRLLPPISSMRRRASGLCATVVTVTGLALTLAKKC